MGQVQVCNCTIFNLGQPEPNQEDSRPSCFKIIVACVGAFISFTGVVLGIVLPLVLKEDGPTPAPTPAPTIYPPTTANLTTTAPPTTPPNVSTYYPTTANPTTTAPSTTPPTAQSRANAILAYINSVKLSTQEISYPPVGNAATAEGRAVQWLIEKDLLMLYVDTSEDRFRLLQRYALLTLWFQVDSPSWTDATGWLVGDECSWYGIMCSPLSLENIGAQDVVTGILLDKTYSGNNLHGNIPVDLGLLTSLFYIDLGHNAITGPIPESIWGLTLLTTLALRETQISGTLSNLIINLPELVYLDVSKTLLTGTIPKEVWTLSKLTSLQLQEVGVTCTLPNSIGSMMSDLKTLNFFKDNCTGTIPESLWKLTQLQFLSLGNWDTPTHFPTSVGNLLGLTHLELPGSRFTGKIPDNVWNLSKLTLLQLNNL
jgi:hypothetical protein